ncbi:MAG: hypothetical protein HZB19_12390 [Chloroflexi bacterium]|nr:hypothetical protein [Chloroflexota bacterium]
MKRLSSTLLFLTLMLGACSRNILTPQATPTKSPTRTKNATHAPTPTFTPAYESCYFVWASQELPELTQKMDIEIRALDPNASANASAFGEDCVFADGHSTFSAMETDFYIRMPVSDLTDEEAFGNWMAQVMLVILQLPSEEVPGPQPGFVEFWFIKSDTENLVVRVPIQQYKDVKEKTGMELFRWFYIPPTAPT